MEESFQEKASVLEPFCPKFGSRLLWTCLFPIKEIVSAKVITLNIFTESTGKSTTNRFNLCTEQSESWTR